LCARSRALTPFILPSGAFPQTGNFGYWTFKQLNIILPGFEHISDYLLKINSLEMEFLDERV
jgi:hypothetical protein